MTCSYWLPPWSPTIRWRFPDQLHRVVLDPRVHVPLGVDEDLLLALGVEEAPLVVARRHPSSVLRLEPADQVLVGVLGVRALAEVGRHLVGVVDHADDDRLVGVAFEMVDDHLLADPRPERGPPAPAGGELRDADPAGALLVVLPLAVPVELDLHPAVLVGVELLTRRADDDGGLRAGDDRLGRDPLRPEGERRRASR